MLEADGRRPSFAVVLVLVLLAAPALFVVGLPILSGLVRFVGPPEPPTGVLSYGQEERRGVSSVGCWREKRRFLPDTRACMSGEAGAYDRRGRPLEDLRVPPGGRVVFGYGDATAPENIRVQAARTDVDPELAEAQQGLASRPGVHLPPFGLRTVEVPVRREGRRAVAALDLEPGRYLVIVSVRVDDASAEGEAFYDFNATVGGKVGAAPGAAARAPGAAPTRGVPGGYS